MSSPSLADAVGKVAAPTGHVPPRALSATELASLVAGLPAGRSGVRDEAMLVLMWRLGLRAGEVARLRLEDINWRDGVVLVRGKRARRDHLPLPVDVGKLLTAYLVRGRPRGRAHREVFLALDAPHGPLSSPAVSSVAARALAEPGSPAGVALTGFGIPPRAGCSLRVVAWSRSVSCCGTRARRPARSTPAPITRALAVLARPWPTSTGAAR